MVELEMAIIAAPDYRNTAVTVRLPGARRAPTSNSLACSKTCFEHEGAKAPVTAVIATGRVHIGHRA
jgi:hypothetical protein